MYFEFLPYFQLCLPALAGQDSQMDEADLSQHPIGQLCFLLTRSCWEENVWLGSGIFLQSAEGKREEGVKLEGTRLRLWPQQRDANAWESLAPLWLNSVQRLPWMEEIGHTHPLSFPTFCRELLYLVLTSMAARSLFTEAPCALDLYLPFWIIFYFFIPPLPKRPF